MHSPDHEPVDQIFGSAVQAKTPRRSLVKVGSSAIKRVAHLFQVIELGLVNRNRRRPPKRRFLKQGEGR